jgi:hypothetical protein
MCRCREAVRSRVTRALLSIMAVATAFGFVSVASAQSPLAQLKVISIRKMTEAEYPDALRTITARITLFVFA